MNLTHCYRFHQGDILFLRRSLPLARAGDYVLLSLGDIVSLARLIRGHSGRVLSRKIVYLLITDIDIFEGPRRGPYRGARPHHTRGQSCRKRFDKALRLPVLQAPAPAVQNEASICY